VILSADRIRVLIETRPKNVDEWFAITPVLDWDSQARPGTGAINVRLGTRFRVPRRARLDTLDHLPAPPSKENVYADDVRVPVGDYFVLHPRQFVIGETIEWVRFPKNLAGFVSGRSSWGREGLIVATAIVVHPYYAGVLALELTNLGEIPVKLYPGAQVAQLFVHEVATDGTVDPPKSMFMASAFPRDPDPLSYDRHVLQAFRADLEAVRQRAETNAPAPPATD
jgi:dCTP deaminase